MNPTLYPSPFRRQSLFKQSLRDTFPDYQEEPPVVCSRCRGIGWLPMTTWRQRFRFRKPAKQWLSECYGCRGTGRISFITLQKPIPQDVPLVPYFWMATGANRTDYTPPFRMATGANPA